MSMTHLAKELDSPHPLSYTKSIEIEESAVSIKVIIIIRDCIKYYFIGQEKETVVYQHLQKFSKHRPQAPPPSSDRVVYADILHFSPKTEQHPPSYDDIELSIPSVTIIPAKVQDDSLLPYANNRPSVSYYMIHY